MSEREALLAPARLQEAMRRSHGIESGPNGSGGMRVVIHFATPGDEHLLFTLLSLAGLKEADA